MSRSPSMLVALLLAGALSASAGADGYLRQGAPVALRFSVAMIPPPPVNELILALGQPVLVEESAATNEPPAQLAGDGLPVPAEGEPDESGSEPAGTPIVVDTLAATNQVASATPPYLPELDPPVVPPTGLANQLGELLLLFNNDRRGGGRSQPAVVVAPPTFLPPQSIQPTPSSRAVYTSE